MKYGVIPIGVIEAVFKFRMFSKNSDKWLAPFQVLEYLVVMVSIIFPVSTTSVSAFVASWVPDSCAGISSHYHWELLSRLTRYLGLHEFSADSNASTLKRWTNNSLKQAMILNRKKTNLCVTLNQEWVRIKEWTLKNTFYSIEYCVQRTEYHGMPCCQSHLGPLF